MKALVLEKQGVMTIRDMPIQGKMNDQSVRIKVKNVGVCGSDVHYYTHGRIGPYIVKEPMILGHEASGVVVEVGKNVKNLKVGDRVCMEPGVPNPHSRAVKLGIYNLDPELTFWATPPDHGCLIEEVIHPAEFTFKLPDNVSMEEGAMVEPLAIGMQAAVKSYIQPGDTAVVIGSGTIGIMCAISALAGGCSKVFVVDKLQERLDIAGGYQGVVPINFTKQNPLDVVRAATDNWGVDVVIEASGAPPVYADITRYCRPGGRIVLVGIPIDPVPFDISLIQGKEITITSVFRYANVYQRCIDLISSGKLDVKRLVSKVYPIDQAIDAFKHAEKMDPKVVKIQIAFP